MEALTMSQFEMSVLECEKLVIVDFGATWCGPCKKIKPILEDLTVTMGDQAAFFYVDAGEQPKIAQNYGVMSLPTLLFFKNGEVKERIVGLVSSAKIVEKIEALA